MRRLLRVLAYFGSGYLMAEVAIQVERAMGLVWAAFAMLVMLLAVLGLYLALDAFGLIGDGE